MPFFDVLGVVSLGGWGWFDGGFWCLFNLHKTCRLFQIHVISLRFQLSGRPLDHLGQQFSNCSDVTHLNCYQFVL